MARLPRFLRRPGVERLSGKRIEKEIEIFVEDLNFWLDRVFLYQKGKTGREAAQFIRKLSERVNSELESMGNDRGFECKNRNAG
ncbi:MAG: hypothetical protein ACP5IL_14860 [Syntrophobacteraceae bacterium]